MIYSRTGWSNLAILFLIAAIVSPHTILDDGWWWLRSVGVAGFSIAAVRCTINAAHAPERRYTR